MKFLIFIFLAVANADDTVVPIDDELLKDPNITATPTETTPAPVTELPPPVEKKVAAPPPPTAEEIPTAAVPPPLELPPPPSEELQPPPVAQEPKSEDNGEGQEARFARIYKKYNQSEISDDQWARIAGERVAESYTLQRGDTLWDISTKFFGNGFYWPKVWQLNDEITNPHLIRPGNVLRFSPGSSVNAPALAVNEGESIETTETEVATQAETEIEPPIDQTPEKPVTAIPPSFPDWVVNVGQYDKNGFSFSVAKKKMSASGLSWVPSIISDTPWQKTGKVMETEGGTLSASTYQRVIIELDGEAQNGDIYTVFSNAGSIEDPTSGKEVGVEVVTRAKLQIIEAVEASPHFYRGMILDTINPVRVGDLVRPGNHFSRAEFTVAGTPTPIAAKIISGEMPKRQVFGLHSIVYLNKGDADGISRGILLNVLRNVKNQNPDSILRLDPKPTGILRIVNVGTHVSTAVIVAQRDAIYPGDETAISGSNLYKKE